MNHSIGWTPWEGDIMVDVSITISNIKGIRRDDLVTLLNEFKDRLESVEVSVHTPGPDGEREELEPMGAMVMCHQPLTQLYATHQRSHNHRSCILRDRKHVGQHRENNDRSVHHGSGRQCLESKCAYMDKSWSLRKDRPFRRSHNTSQKSRKDETS
jgi:hypothetical protein